MNELLLHAVGSEIKKEKLKVFTQISGGKMRKKEVWHFLLSNICLLG